MAQETWNGAVVGADPAKGERPLASSRRASIPASDNKPNPGTPSAAYREMAERWNKIEAVLGGTAEMRRRGTEFLPKHTEEKDQRYQERLERAVLLNVAELTLNSWTGRPFADQMTISEDVPESIRALLDDVDMQGNNLGVFCRGWFREGLAKGCAHVLVDFPGAAPEGQTRTLADDSDLGLRPYFSFVKPENLLFAAAETVNGREILTHVRIREDITERAGWGERVVRRIRVFNHDVATGQVTFEVYRLDEKGRNWTLETPPQMMDIDRIPLVTFYSDRRGLMLAKPPLEDLVDLNIAHWQSDADQTAILTVGRFPMLGVSGVPSDETDKVVMSPYRVLGTSDPSGKWYFIEHSGTAIAAGAESLAKIEERMAHYGAEFLRRRPGSETATARALASAESTSPLEDAAVRFNDALAQAMSLLGGWLEIPDEEVGTVSIETDLGEMAGDASDVTLLTSARASRDISRETLLKEMVRRGTLDENFDADDDQKELEAEILTGAPTVPTDRGQAFGQ